MVASCCIQLAMLGASCQVLTRGCSCGASTGEVGEATASGRALGPCHQGVTAMVNNMAHLVAHVVVFTAVGVLTSGIDYKHQLIVCDVLRSFYFI